MISEDSYDECGEIEKVKAYLRRGALGGILATDDSLTSVWAILRGELGVLESESVVDASEEEFE